VISAALCRQLRVIRAKTSRLMAFPYSASLRVRGWHVIDALSWVDAGEWSALAERAYQSFAELHGVAAHESNAVRAQFSDLVTQFASHWRIER
jgi:hypothetical protein